MGGEEGADCQGYAVILDPPMVHDSIKRAKYPRLAVYLSSFAAVVAFANTCQYIHSKSCTKKAPGGSPVLLICALPRVREVLFRR